MDNNGDDNLRFQWYDYTLFVLMLTVSTLIGLYFGYVNRNNNSTKDFFLGGKTMKSFPIAMSISASVITSVALTSLPADVYKYGAVQIFIAFGLPFVFLFIYFAILPIYFNLQLTSIYEYMGLRFNRKIQLITSFLYSLGMFIYLPVSIYLPALAIAQGTGFNINYMTIVVSVICIFYTTIGGLKTVVWTDALQMFLVVFTFVVVSIVGSIRSGGVQEVWQKSLDGERLDIDFDVDPTREYTFWTLMVGLLTHWLQYTSVNQSCIQKCLALPTMKQVKQCLIEVSIIFGVIFICITIIGLIMYSEFKDCDPLISKKIRSYDQLVPYYILHVTQNIPGLVGIFIAALFSASLSTLSAGLNALSCIIYNDFLKEILPSNISQKLIKLILCVTTVLTGLVCTGLVFVVQKLGNAFPIIVGIRSIAAGPIFGLFILGMFFPRANSKGATWGVLGSLVFMTWMVFTSQYYKMNKYIKEEFKPMSVAACPLENITITNIEDDWKPNPIFRISFYYNSLIGMLVVLLVGLPVSWLTKAEKENSRKELISPIMHWALPKYQLVEQSEIESVEMRKI